VSLSFNIFFLRRVYKIRVLTNCRGHAKWRDLRQHQCVTQANLFYVEPTSSTPAAHQQPTRTIKPPHKLRTLTSLKKVTRLQKMHWHTDVVYIYTKEQRNCSLISYTQHLFPGTFLIYRVPEDALAHGCSIYIQNTDRQTAL